MLRSLILRTDDIAQCGTNRLQRLLNWSQGAKAARIMRILAVVAATPATLSVLPVYAAAPLLVALAVLALRQGDDKAAGVAIAALIRLAFLLAAGGAALLLLLAPTLLWSGVTVAAVLNALGEYVHDLD